jgi:hypothetical protein
MEASAGRQFVGMDLHRRRSVLVRMTADGEVLERVRIVNDVDGLAAVSRGPESARRWCWRPPTAGTGWTCCGSRVRGCIWRIRWG